MSSDKVIDSGTLAAQLAGQTVNYRNIIEQQKKVIAESYATIIAQRKKIQQIAEQATIIHYSEIEEFELLLEAMPGIRELLAPAAIAIEFLTRYYPEGSTHENWAANRDKMRALFALMSRAYPPINFNPNNVDRSAYEDAREDVQLWRKRALEAEAKLADAPYVRATLGGWEYLPTDLRTHLGDFITALTLVARKCGEPISKQYWEKQVELTHKIYAALNGKPHPPLAPSYEEIKPCY